VKTLNCTKCNKFLGEIIKGKIHNKTTLLCETCMEFYKTCESLANYNKTQKPDIPAFLNDLMNGKVK